MIIPKVNDWVLIKDGSSELRIGKIKEVIQSDDGEIHSAVVKTKLGGEGCYPVTNLRYLEYHQEGENKIDMGLIKNIMQNTNKRASRKTAEIAQKKITETVSLINNILSVDKTKLGATTKHS